MSNSLVSRLEVIPRDLIGPDGQFEGAEVDKYRILPGMTSGELYEAFRGLDAICQKAREADVADEVAALKARTAGRNQGNGEAAFSAALMTSDLAAYPIDVVRYACQYWIEGGRDAKWFPSWPELREICERRVKPRKRLHATLERLLRESRETNRV